jgi:Membrane-bound serine protease (ClpP class)
VEILDFIIQISIIQGLILIIGVTLVIVEMFHPGFGAPGITGTILIIIGIIFIASNFQQALILIVLVLAILGIALSIILHSATKGKLSRSPLILKHSQQKETGYIGIEDLEFFLGKEGVSFTVLRPSGVVDFDGVKIDVVSEGSFIPQGKKVKVVKVIGRSIVVREV